MDQNEFDQIIVATEPTPEAGKHREVQRRNEYLPTEHTKRHENFLPQRKRGAKSLNIFNLPLIYTDLHQ
jgi:hypothetical protein